MDDVIVIESEESENSIIEVEVPKKPTPPLISIEDEDIIMNIQERNKRESVLAKDFIKNDKKLSRMSKVAKNLTSPSHWTSDMIKFYDDDWGNEENFVVEKLQEKMNKNPLLWDVSRKARPLIQGKHKKIHTRCWNCGQRGHNSSFCPDPPHVIKCHMCGTEGHEGCFCPNSKCLNCGNQSREYVTCCTKCKNQLNEKCSRCHLIGHNFINCTDHWRLFHMTTGTTSIRTPGKNINKSDAEMWCCNCGRKGHNQFWCNRRKSFGGFIDSFPFVSSYERALNFSQNNYKSNDIPSKNLKRHKRKKEKVDKSEKVLRINPHNKAIWKDKIEIKNKLKRFKKNKRSKNKKKNRQKFFDGLLI